MKTVATVVSVVVLALSAPVVRAADKKVDFAKDIRPIFKKSCMKCHSLDPKKPKKHAAGKFRLDDRAAAMKGGRSGQAIIPGDATDSLLYRLLNGPVPRPAQAAGLDDEKDIPPMPKAKRGRKWKPLPAKEIATIKDWIDQGAIWPAK